jgi:Tfp pilus assembly protein FimT
MNNVWHVTGDRKMAVARETQPCHVSRVTCHAVACTLIEIMIVVAIMGLIAAMGVPSILQTFRKDGMRKAVSDVMDACAEARQDAILNNKTIAVIFHPQPQDRRFEVEGAAGGKNASSGRVTSSTLPDGVEFAMLDINLQDYGASEWARVFFYPNGTSDEMTIVLISQGDRKKITLEFSTALASVSDVDK